MGPILDGPCGSQWGFEENKKGIGNWKETKSWEVCLKSLIEYVMYMYVCIIHVLQPKHWNRGFVVIL